MTNVTVVLDRTSVFTRWPCLVCGGESDEDSVLADVLENNKRTGYVVCSRCLGSGNVAETMRATAARYRAHAEYLDAIAANPPTLPTLAEWEAAIFDCHGSR